MSYAWECSRYDTLTLEWVPCTLPLIFPITTPTFVVPAGTWNLASEYTFKVATTVNGHHQNHSWTVIPTLPSLVPRLKREPMCNVTIGLPIELDGSRTHDPQGNSAYVFEARWSACQRLPGGRCVQSEQGADNPFQALASMLDVLSLTLPGARPSALGQTWMITLQYCHHLSLRCANSTLNITFVNHTAPDLSVEGPAPYVATDPLILTAVASLYGKHVPPDAYFVRWRSSQLNLSDPGVVVVLPTDRWQIGIRDRILNPGSTYSVVVELRERASGIHVTSVWHTITPNRPPQLLYGCLYGAYNSYGPQAPGKQLCTTPLFTSARAPPLLAGQSTIHVQVPLDIFIDPDKNYPLRIAIGFRHQAVAYPVSDVWFSSPWPRTINVTAPVLGMSPLETSISIMVWVQVPHTLGTQSMSHAPHLPTIVTLNVPTPLDRSPHRGGKIAKMFGVLGLCLAYFPVTAQCQGGP